MHGSGRVDGRRGARRGRRAAGVEELYRTGFRAELLQQRGRFVPGGRHRAGRAVRRPGGRGAGAAQPGRGGVAPDRPSPCRTHRKGAGAGPAGARQGGRAPATGPGPAGRSGPCNGGEERPVSGAEEGTRPAWTGADEGRRGEEPAGSGQGQERQVSGAEEGTRPWTGAEQGRRGEEPAGSGQGTGAEQDRLGEEPAGSGQGTGAKQGRLGEEPAGSGQGQERHPGTRLADARRGRICRLDMTGWTCPLDMIRRAAI